MSNNILLFSTFSVDDLTTNLAKKHNLLRRWIWNLGHHSLWLELTLFQQQRVVAPLHVFFVFHLLLERNLHQCKVILQSFYLLRQLHSLHTKTFPETYVLHGMYFNMARSGARFSELEGSRLSSCQFTTATPLFFHPKNSNLHKSHGLSCWRLGGGLDPTPTTAPEHGISPKTARSCNNNSEVRSSKCNDILLVRIAVRHGNKFGLQFTAKDLQRLWCPMPNHRSYRTPGLVSTVPRWITVRVKANHIAK